MIKLKDTTPSWKIKTLEEKDNNDKLSGLI
jgi:hypothetical protein